LIKCPICERFDFEKVANYEICGVCQWENDPLQFDDHDDDMGANRMSVNQARAEWRLLNTHDEKSAAQSA